MTRAVLLLSAVILWPPPAAAEPSGVTGWASAYAPGRFEEVVRWRFDNDVWRVQPPRTWYYEARGYIATTDCERVGDMATIYDADGKAYPVLVGDCSGDPETTAWMLENNIVLELDARLWEDLTTKHGRPLRIELR